MDQHVHHLVFRVVCGAWCLYVSFVDEGLGCRLEHHFTTGIEVVGWSHSLSRGSQPSHLVAWRALHLRSALDVGSVVRQIQHFEQRGTQPSLVQEMGFQFEWQGLRIFLSISMVRV